MNREEAETAVARVKAALAEVGSPDGNAHLEKDGLGGWTVGHTARVLPERRLLWTAWLIAGVPVLCWPCDVAMCESGIPAESLCDHDPWMAERPRLERAP